MMERTDRHFRVMMRQLTRHTLLYTEMVTAMALRHGDRGPLLDFDPIEHPISLQVGGDDPALMADAARMAEDWGYDEVDINIGCPSDRVQKGRFGACLMRWPADVARVVEAMRAATSLPVTVKHRIGVDELDDYDHMAQFVRVVAESGADRFTVHARKAWLSGLSPKENRNVPPLRYAEVWQLQSERPDLDIVINGGIRTLDSAEEHLEHVRGVMIGRGAWDTPWIFADADRRLFGAENPASSPAQVVQRLEPYLARWLRDVPEFKPHHITRHWLSLFAGRPGTRAYKQVLSQRSRVGVDASSLVRDALAAVERTQSTLGARSIA
ncbi:MAG: tRNA-dihydrouridine synthase A [Myxococcota bacterium]|jgi:tRNA-dihydrouridine synthase A